MKTFIVILTLIFTAGICKAQNEKFIVHFPFNSSEIIPAEKVRLDSVIRVLPKTALSLSGHTDSRGSSAYNEKLSQRRAETVKQYLLANNYPADLLADEKALGESKLITTDDTEEAKGLVNRRVEITWQNVVPAAATAVVIEKNIPSVNNISGSRQITDVIKDSSLKKGDVLILRDLNFEGGRHKLLKSAFPQLESLLRVMKDNPGLKISIEGHVCCLPDNTDGFDFDPRTEDLSYRRAKAIAEYLVEAGIDGERTFYKGFAHSAPIFPFPEKTEEEKTANRRVEVRILDR